MVLAQAVEKGKTCQQASDLQWKEKVLLSEEFYFVLTFRAESRTFFLIATFSIYKLDRVTLIKACILPDDGTPPTPPPHQTPMQNHLNPEQSP